MPRKGDPVWPTRTSSWWLEPRTRQAFQERLEREQERMNASKEGRTRGRRLSGVPEREMNLLRRF